MPKAEDQDYKDMEKETVIFHGKVEGQVLLALLPVENKDPNQQFINCTSFKTSSRISCSRFSKRDMTRQVRRILAMAAVKTTWVVSLLS